MNAIKTFEEFVNDKEYNLLLEEISNGDFTRFEKLDKVKRIKIMETWDQEQWNNYCMQNTISEEECFDSILKYIEEDDE